MWNSFGLSDYFHCFEFWLLTTRKFGEGARRKFRRSGHGIAK
uniref:Uncharacterized protein n=1 Tax=Pseudomonas syringae TaxID=317 RepID=I3W2J7_PSESX|nr:hypothetical protein [Pseudomonas syringae]